MKIYLDLDGVLVDFVGGLCAWCNKPNPYERPEAVGVWNCYGLLGLHKCRVDEILGDPAFWIELASLPDAPLIIGACLAAARPDEIGILTCTSGYGGAAIGKMAWKKHHMPHWQKFVLLDTDDTPATKAWLGGPDTILIDDSDDNVAAYSSAGPAILVPRPWNALHSLSDRAAEYVMSELQTIVTEQEVT